MSPTANAQDEALRIFKASGALLEGHFILRSGRHSGRFFQCARVGERLDYVSRLAALLLQKWTSSESRSDFDTVVAIAMGGLVIGQELARQTQKRYLFLEKVEGRLALRRNFTIASGERVLLVEDVVTRGGRVHEALDIIRKAGGQTIGVAILVDRQETPSSFGVPLCSLVQLNFPTYPPEALPEALKCLPAVKPGS